MYFYPRPPGGGRHDRLRLGLDFGISIHALRVEGDQIRRKEIIIRRISIHALRVEGDQQANARLYRQGQEFLSTPSGWRATPH